METIKIKSNKLGDTRTATRVPTISEFEWANRSHCEDVKNMMRAIASEIRDRGIAHDYTKTSESTKSLFYRELCATIEGKMDDLTAGEWYPLHCAAERHHLNVRCPNDVNLIDVIEMLCDCICAGMARSGEVKPIEIETDILKIAVQNTVTMLANAVEIVK